MRAVVFRGKRKLAIEEVQKPEPGPDEVRVQVAYCGICGSDVAGYLKGNYEIGVTIGHEMSGIIDCVGSSVVDFQPGDWVVPNAIATCGKCDMCRRGRLSLCRNIMMYGISHSGGMADFIVVKADALHRIPDGVDLDLAAATDPVANALHAIRQSGLQITDRALVLGAGPIGAYIALWAKASGADVLVSEPHAYRRQLLARYGLQTVDPMDENLFLVVDEWSKGAGADIVYDAAGVPQTLQDAPTLVSPGGRIFVMGIAEEAVAADFMSLVIQEQTIQGGYCSYLEYDATLRAFATGLIEPRGTLTKVIGLEQVPDAFEALTSRGSSLQKVLIAVNPI